MPDQFIYTPPSGSPTGVAGGDLAGTYPNPTLNTSISTAVAFSGLGNTTLGGSSVLKLPNGSVGTSSLNLGDTASGFYRPGTNQIGITTNGVLAFSVIPTNQRVVIANECIIENKVAYTTAANMGQNILRSSGGGTGNIQFGFGPTQTGGSDAILTSPAAAVFQFGAAAADTTGVSQTLQAQGVTTGGTNNQAGGSLSLKPGQGKGNVGSSLILYGATLGASGNTLQTMTEVARVLAATTAPVWQWSANNSTGAGAALLGANSPAVTLTAPYTWITVVTSDGSTGYMPVWK